MSGGCPTVVTAISFENKRAVLSQGNRAMQRVFPAINDASIVSLLVSGSEKFAIKVKVKVVIARA